VLKLDVFQLEIKSPLKAFCSGVMIRRRHAEFRLTVGKLGLALGGIQPCLEIEEEDPLIVKSALDPHRE
jgi:hypothetical protein